MGIDSDCHHLYLSPQSLNLCVLDGQTNLSGVRHHAPIRSYPASVTARTTNHSEATKAGKWRVSSRRSKNILTERESGNSKSFPRSRRDRSFPQPLRQPIEIAPAADVLSYCE